ncbi:MAG: hypothetical protein HZA49_05865 [Planctomycetes bacterium]|nr:hypothetical protein [Planctomycetota bacterium]
MTNSVASLDRSQVILLHGEPDLKNVKKIDEKMIEEWVYLNPATRTLLCYSFGEESLIKCEEKPVRYFNK